MTIQRSIDSLYKKDLELEKYYERAYKKYKKQKDDEYKHKTRTI